MSRGSSFGNTGISVAWDPAAMMACSNAIRWVPSGPTTSSMLGPTKVAAPVKTRTLRCFARPASPLVSCATTESFQAASFESVIFGLPKATP